MQAAVRKNATKYWSTLYPSPHLASSFHSTPMSLAKWKNKWDPKGEGRDQKPSKTYTRYAVRQKRAEIKKALKDYLLYGKSSKLQFEDEDVYGCADGISSRNGRAKNCSLGSSEKSKPHGSSYTGKGKRGRSRRWQNKQGFHDEDDFEHPETIFEAVFGGHRGFTWSSWENFQCDYSKTEFERREESRWKNAWKRILNESDTDDEFPDVGSHSQRVTLGLPPRGPLKLDDVKNAFRASALKWHPDKHQGPSQAMATEKFKLCVDAYNSLCDSLRPT